MKKLGKASEGWTAKKAFLEKEKRMETERNLRQEKLSSDHTKKEHTIWEIWLDYKSYKSNTIKNMKSCETYMKKLVPFYNLTPMKITNRQLQDFTKQLEVEINQKGQLYAPQTITHFLKMLQILINFGTKRELCTKPAHLHFEMPKFDNKKHEALNDNQMRKYLNVLEEYKDIYKTEVILMKLIAYTGIRRNAALHLRWSDIDFSAQLITLFYKFAKNNKTQLIPLPFTIAKLLKELPHHSEFIFANEKGVISQKHYDRIAQKFKEKAELPEDYRPFHMLRHTFATQLVNSNGGDIYTAQQLMAHGSPQMTLRYTSHLDKKLREGSSIIENKYNKFIMIQ